MLIKPQSHVKRVINNNNDATREEKDTALTLLKATFDEKVRDIESATNINEISERKASNR